MMKQAIIFLLLGCLMLPARAQNKSENMDRIDLCKQNYTALFGGEALTGEGTDPEFMAILQKFIFGEVFAVGDLDRPTRELITCTVLSVMQTLPQLKAHAAAALQVGVKPIELREAVYQCAPFIGFPKTLNAIGVINEVFREKVSLYLWKTRLLPPRRIVMRKVMPSNIRFMAMKLLRKWPMFREVWAMMWLAS